jgi:hypothetical protein
MICDARLLALRQARALERDDDDEGIAGGGNSEDLPGEGLCLVLGSIPGDLRS